MTKSFGLSHVRPETTSQATPDYDSRPSRSVWGISCAAGRRPFRPIHSARLWDKHDQRLEPVAEQIIEWAEDRDLDMSYGAEGSEFRIRAPTDGAGEARVDVGPSADTMIARSGGLTIQLRHLLRGPAFRDVATRGGSSFLASRVPPPLEMGRRPRSGFHPDDLLCDCGD
jgi:hypothetical protein